MQPVNEKKETTWMTYFTIKQRISVEAESAALL